jgi:hypothetical protein
MKNQFNSLLFFSLCVDFRPREPDASHLSPTYSDIDYTDDDLVSMPVCVMFFRLLQEDRSCYSSHDNWV